jgi:dihydrofolate reductase
MIAPQTDDDAHDIQPSWIAVVAVADNGVIGRGDQLPWRLSSDLRRFKSLTMGHCLLMGRKTFQSIGRPLPGRQTIILSRRNFQCEYPEIKVVSKLSQVNNFVEDSRNVMVVGGAEIYRAALRRCSQIWITRVRAEVEGDVYFPTVDWSQWKRIHFESLEASDKDQWPTEFEKWTRK